MHHRLASSLGGACPICGHALRLVVVEGRLTWFCPLCGEVRR